jgi:hypothetical protein
VSPELSSSSTLFPQVNRARSLARLVEWADGKFAQFEFAAGQVVRPLGRADVDRVRYITLEAANTWASFLRTYYLASATGAWLGDGSRVTGHGRTMRVDRALTSAVHTIDPSLSARTGPWTHRDEPNWLDPGIVLKLLIAHGLSNAAGFRNALGAGTGAHQRLLTFRNFVAHRGRRSALAVRDMTRKLGVRANSDPIELPFYRAPRRPVPLFTEWLVELRAIIQLSPN